MEVGIHHCSCHGLICGIMHAQVTKEPSARWPSLLDAITRALETVADSALTILAGRHVSGSYCCFLGLQQAQVAISEGQTFNHYEALGEVERIRMRNMACPGLLLQHPCIQAHRLSLFHSAALLIQTAGRRVC